MPRSGAGMIATFYSFKGGVGRSMAMANVAEILADWGYRVVVCDWDLEAPGLERYLFDQPEAVAQARAAFGIVDLIAEYKSTLSAADGLHPPREADPDFIAVGQERPLWLRRPSSCCAPVYSARRTGPGWVKVLPAGRRAGEAAAGYSEAVRALDWSEFYRTWAGGSYLEFFRAELLGERRFADIVLIDSRTGVTEVGGVCTHHLADAVVLFSGANDQNTEGTKWMAELLVQPSLIEQRGQRPLAVLPVASRIERSSEVDYLAKFEQQFVAEFSRYLPCEITEPAGGPKAVLDGTQIPYIPKYSFTETLVARQEPGERHRDLYAAYESLAHALVRWGVARCGLENLAAGSEPAVRLAGGGRTSQSAPKGRYYLASLPEDAPRAAALATLLQSAGLDLYTCTGPGTGGDRWLEIVGEAAGAIILVPAAGAGEWLEAHGSRALATQALRPGFRALALLSASSTQAAAPLLQRLRTLRLAEEITELSGLPLAHRIFAELLPEPVLLPEPPESATLEALVSPTETHARFCLGREDKLRAMARAIELQLAPGGTGEIILAGIEASGKTALLRAGIIPLLHTGWIGPRGVPWRTAFVRIDREDPYAAVSRAVAQAVGFAGELAVTKTGAAPRELLEHLAAHPQPLALILDKVEDLPLDHGFGTAEIAACYALLGQFRAAVRGEFLLIVAIRERYLADFQQRVLQMARAQVVTLETPDPEAMRKLLEGTVRFFGLRFEAGLVDRILRDIERIRNNSRLPGLTLRALIEARTDDVLTHAAYAGIGGVEQLFVGDCSRALDGLSAIRKDLAARLLTALVDPRTSRPRPLPRLEALARAERSLPPGSDEVKHNLAQVVLASLAGWNLVHCEGENVTLASEAALRIPTLKTWFEQSRPQLEAQARLDDLAQIWSDTGKSPAFAAGLDPDVFRSLGAQSGLAHDLLAAAENERDRLRERERDLQVALETEQRRTRKLAMIGSAVVCAILLGSQFLLVHTTKTAETANQKLRDKLDKQLANATRSTRDFTNQIQSQQKKYDDLRSEKEQLQRQLDSQKNAPPTAQAPGNETLPPNVAPAPPEIRLRVDLETETQTLYDYAQGLKESLLREGFGASTLRKDPTGLKQSEVKYYFDKDAEGAARLLKILQARGVENLKPKPRLVTGSPDAKPGQFAVVLAPGAPSRMHEQNWLYFGNFDTAKGTWKRRNLEDLKGLPAVDETYTSRQALQLHLEKPQAPGQLGAKAGLAFAPGWKFRVVEISPPRENDGAVWGKVEAVQPPAPDAAQANPGGR